MVLTIAGVKNKKLLRHTRPALSYLANTFYDFMNECINHALKISFCFDETELTKHHDYYFTELLTELQKELDEEKQE